MKRMAVALLVLGLPTVAAAQIVIVQRDPVWGVTYQRSKVVIYGPAYYPPPPGLLPPPRSPVKDIPPPGKGPILGPGYDQDTRGVDLDVTPLKKPEPADEGKPLPGVEVSKEKPAVRPGEPVKEVKPPPMELPPPALPRPPDPLPDPRDESARLLEMGVHAFQEGVYGLAAQCFRQAADVDPKLARAFFWLAQAEFAMGKYQGAVAAIHKGMKIDKQWPRTPVQPRLDLYAGRDVEYADHMKRLTEAVAAAPNHPTLLFLVAHQLWFDGQRKDALALFQRVRPLTKDPSFIDAFLAAGGPGVPA
jgi:hypothetical protein